MTAKAKTDPSPDEPITTADVAALNGVDTVESDEPAVDAVEDVSTRDESPAVFISAGMAYDLDVQGWAVDPNTGRKVVRDR